MNNDYSVYEHVFPNGKKYIGISKNPEERWMKGIGYKSQPKIWNAISHYGWDNIEHNIIISGITKEQAQKLEQYLIAVFDTIENGYNTTIGGETILSTYLNSHVLEMIRKSKEYDLKYGIKQRKDDIVSFVEDHKYIRNIAEAINLADMLIESVYSEYKRYSGVTPVHDLGCARVDCYFWTMSMILNGKELNGDTPYWDMYIKDFIKDFNEVKQ